MMRQELESFQLIGWLVLQKVLCDLKHALFKQYSGDTRLKDILHYGNKLGETKVL